MTKKTIVDKYPWAFFLLALSLLALNRIIPEILIGKMPIGYDSSNPYVTSFLYYNDTFKNSIQNFNLYYYIFSIFRNWGFDALLTIKSLAVVLYLLHCLLFLLIIKDGFKFKNNTLLLGLLIFGFQLATLRFSWDLQRNELGIIFFLTSIWLWIKFINSKNKKRYLYVPFAILFFILIFPTHQLVSLIGACSIILSIVYYLLTKILPQKAQSFALIIPISLIFIAIFLFQKDNTFLSNYGIKHGFWDPNIQDFNPKLVFQIFNLMFMPFLFPVSLYGLIKKPNNYLIIITAIICGLTFTTLALTTKGFVYWDRWMYFLGTPLIIFFLQTMDILEDKHLQKINLTTKILLIYIPVFLLLSYKSFYFLNPKATLYKLKIEGPIFNILPSTMITNAYVGNWYEAKISRNIPECFNELEKIHDGGSVIALNGGYFGAATYFAPKLGQFYAYNLDISSIKSKFYAFGYNYSLERDGKYLKKSVNINPQCPIYQSTNQ